MEAKDITTIDTIEILKSRLITLSREIGVVQELYIGPAMRMPKRRPIGCRVTSLGWSSSPKLVTSTKNNPRSISERRQILVQACEITRSQNTFSKRKFRSQDCTLSPSSLFSSLGRLPAGLSLTKHAVRKNPITPGKSSTTKVTVRQFPSQLSKQE